MQQFINTISEHKVEFNWVKCHIDHSENECYETLSNKGFNSNKLLDDIGYEHKEINKSTHSRKTFNQKNKVKKENIRNEY